MSDKQDDKLEILLRSRRIESATPELAQRIIMQASHTRQIQPVGLSRWVAGLFSEFHLPRPAYVLAGALIVGIVVGLNTPLETTSTSNDLPPVSVQSFLYSDRTIP